MRQSSKVQISALALSAAILFGAAGDLRAQNQTTWVYEGFIQAPPTISPPVTPGDDLPFEHFSPVKFIVTFDLDTIGNPIDAHSVEYPGAVTDVVALVGSYTATGSGGTVEITNDEPSAVVPSFTRDDHFVGIEQPSGALAGDIDLGPVVVTPTALRADIFGDTNAEPGCLSSTNLEADPPDTSVDCGDIIGRMFFKDSADLGGPDVIDLSIFLGSITRAGPADLVAALAAQILSLNLATGISNSLDAKLDSAMKALDDMNTNNDGAAINSLEALINAVEAQRGKKIPDADADQIIAQVEMVIDQLMNP